MKTKTEKESNAIIESVQGWINGYMRKRGKGQKQLIADLESALAECPSVYTKLLVETLLDIMRVNVNDDYTLQDEDVLDAEFLDFIEFLN